MDLHANNIKKIIKLYLYNIFNFYKQKYNKTIIIKNNNNYKYELNNYSSNKIDTFELKDNITDYYKGHLIFPYIYLQPFRFLNIKENELNTEIKKINDYKITINNNIIFNLTKEAENYYSQIYSYFNDNINNLIIFQKNIVYQYFKHLFNTNKIKNIEDIKNNKELNKEVLFSLNINLLSNNGDNIFYDILIYFLNNQPTLLIIELPINIKLNNNVKNILYYIYNCYHNIVYFGDIYTNQNFFLIFYKLQDIPIKYLEIDKNKIPTYNNFDEKFEELFNTINNKYELFINNIKSCENTLIELYKNISSKININIEKIILEEFKNRSVDVAIHQLNYHIDSQYINKIEETAKKVYSKERIDSFIIDWYPVKKYNINISKIKYAPSSFYSTTFFSDAELTTNLIKKELYNDAKNLIITDATSNIGGNTLSFSFNFKKVNAVEISKDEYDALVNNMNLFKRNNIEFYNKNYSEIYKNINQDIIFMDPPWGGEDYKYHEKLDLYMGDLTLKNLIINIIKLNQTKIIVLKLPNNYDINNINLFELYKKIVVHKIKNYLLIIILLN
jgi:hypothetical protein